MPPVSLALEVAKPQPLASPRQDAGDPPGDLSSDEILAASWRLVIEEDATAGKDAVGLAVVDGHPVPIHLRYPVRASGMERRRLVLGRRRQAEHFGGGGLVETGRSAGGADRLE